MRFAEPFASQLRVFQPQAIHEANAVAVVSLGAAGLVHLSGLLGPGAVARRLAPRAPRQAEDRALVITLEQVVKTYPTPYGPNVVLDGLTAVFPQGESVGILGRNGAGKSTLLRILAGAEMADAGKISRVGRVSWPIGFSGGFAPSLSGEENSRFIARIYGEQSDRVVASAREFAEIGNYFYMPVRTYSSGMRARLAFGLSMAIEFDTYLVDEVTAVGDQSFQDRCRRAFADRQGRSAVIIVSHSLSTIESYCRRCAVLTRGKLHIYDTVKEAAAVYQAEMAA